MSITAFPWPQIIVSGFALGSFYALVALGFSLIFGVTRAFNLAHGEMIVLASYLAFVLWKFCQVPFYLTLPVCLLALGLLTLPLYLLLRRLKEPYALNTLVVTFGLALLLQNLMLVLFSADYRLLNSGLSSFTIPGLGLTFSWNQVVLLLLSLLATAGVHLGLHHTFLGKALRATIQDQEAAQISGINVKSMSLIAFGLGGMLIGLAGPLYGQNMYLYPLAGAEATLIAIILTIFAGVGRIRALLLGGWLLGLMESAAILTVGSKWRELVSAAVLLILLYFRPQGISFRKPG
ncbi:MAG: branched-chain amino acid ABC transporter permease [Syntrophales bacterium]|nr:branched-chain amino acid ABC transporter permease [Syntrophales bacterium]MDD5641761.1 branched-chain amino acid ABC transporter permease [Syntrophales bacterium]